VRLECTMRSRRFVAATARGGVHPARIDRVRAVRAPHRSYAAPRTRRSLARSG